MQKDTLDMLTVANNSFEGGETDQVHTGEKKRGFITRVLASKSLMPLTEMKSFNLIFPFEP